MLPAVEPAQTAFGVLNVWLKKRESADAPNDQHITLYTKSKALVIGVNACGARGRNSLMASETLGRLRTGLRLKASR
jgi:hypothetical protein